MFRLLAFLAALMLAAPLFAQAPAIQPARTYLELPEILDRSETGGRMRLLKMKIVLELDGAADLPQAQAVMPRIVENLKAYMREIPDEDLRGSAGLLRLRERFLVRVNAAATPVQVKDVLFQEILFQR